MGLKSVSNFQKINMSFLANMAYQIALISGQLLIILYIYLKDGVEMLDSFFYILALLLPYYTFLLLGLRQLRLSNSISKGQVHLVRFVSMFVFLLISVFVVNDINNVFYIFIFWKMNDFIIDAVSLEFQINKSHGLLLRIAALRIIYLLVFLIYFDGELSSFILFSLPVLSLYFFYMVRTTRFYSFSFYAFKSMGYLGLIASISSVVVSYPRVVLSESATISSGVLSLISVVSYLYIIGQIVISATLPIILPKISKDDIIFKFNINKYLVLISVLSFVFVIVVFSLSWLGLWVADYELFEIELYLLFLLLIMNLPFVFLVNFIEGFSSVRNVEKLVVISTFSAALLSICLSNYMADLWGGVGYALIIVMCFLLRFIISYYFIVIYKVVG